MLDKVREAVKLGRLVTASGIDGNAAMVHCGTGPVLHDDPQAVVKCMVNVFLLHRSLILFRQLEPAHLLLVKNVLELVISLGL